MAISSQDVFELPEPSNVEPGAVTEEYGTTEALLAAT